MSQRCHWYVNVGVAPFQTPSEPVSVFPSIGEPLITGRVESTGAFVGAALTIPVAPELRVFRPAEFAAATITRSRWPRSSEVRMYRVLCAASGMFMHPLPAAVQRDHW